MKKLLLVAIALIITSATFAQKDSSRPILLQTPFTSSSIIFYAYSYPKGYEVVFAQHPVVYTVVIDSTGFIAAKDSAGKFIVYDSAKCIKTFYTCLKIMAKLDDEKLNNHSHQ